MKCRISAHAYDIYLRASNVIDPKNIYNIPELLFSMTGNHKRWRWITMTPYAEPHRRRLSTTAECADSCNKVQEYAPLYLNVTDNVTGRVKGHFFPIYVIARFAGQISPIRLKLSRWNDMDHV